MNPDPSSVTAAPSAPADGALFEAIVMQASEAIVFADRAGVIRMWNRAAEAMFGFSAAEAVGASLDIIVPERFRAAHWAAFGRAIESGRTRPGDPVRTTRSLHKEEGRKLYVDMSFGIVTGADGAVLGSMAVGRDCTERHLAKQAS